MMRSLKEAGQDLVKALDEACAVHFQQQQNYEALRQSSDTTSQNFLSMLTAQQSASDSEEAMQKRHELVERMKSNVSPQNLQMADAKALLGRLEQSLCDSQIALMRLYAFPEAQDSAERIADILRTLRLLPLDEKPDQVPFPKFDGAVLSESDPKKQKVAMALGFMQEMDGYSQEVRQFHEEQINRTEILLKQAQEEAKGLAQKLRL